jgi:hypothetical protein
MAELGGGRSFVATPFRTLYTFHSMSPLILRPNWQVEAVRPRSLCLGLGLLLEAATRTHLTEYHTRSNKDARWRLTVLLLPPCLHPLSLLSIERYF